MSKQKSAPIVQSASDFAVVVSKLNKLLVNAKYKDSTD